MRILHIFDHSIPLHSGYAFRSIEILKEQNNIGWETIQLTSTKQYKQSKRTENVDGFAFYRTYQKFPFLNKIPILNQYRVVADLKRRIKEVALEEKPDIIHAHSPCLNGLAALSVGRKFNIPVVYEMRASWEDAAVSHGSTSEGSFRYKLSRMLESYVLKNVNAITTICEGLKKDIASRGIDQSLITVIPNAVSIEKFSEVMEDNLIKEKYALEDKLVLGFVGSFYHYEGIDILIRALPEILRIRSNVVVLLVGGGPQEDALKQLTKELSLNKKVIFTGRVDHSTVTQYYNNIDILVYARRSIRLTDIVTPLKPLEAMAGERMFIASDVGGHKELVSTICSECLFHADDQIALVNAVINLIESKNTWRDRLEKLRKYVSEERTWETSVQGYESVYGRLNCLK